MMRRTLAIAFAFALVLSASGAALAGQGAPGQGIHLIAGGGRIWEGAASHPTAAAAVNGDVFKVGPGGEPESYVCHWTVRLIDVAGTNLDGSIFRGSICRDVVVWSAGNPGGPEAAMRILIIGTLDGSAGYAVALRAVDVGEPGAFDTVRFSLYHGTAPWPDPGTLMYDSAGDFHHDVNSRTNLDAGNFQSWVDAPTS
jgi:hypothetical protein